MIEKLRFFDFCAGIGSAHFAFSNLGLECAGYSEIESTAITMYQLFHGTHHKNYGDLMKINPHKLPDFDIMCAGFPCQTFSIVGKRQGFEDSRGQIIYGLCDILNVKQPKAFLLENVKGLVNINKGQSLKNILSMLEGAGYSVTYKVIESTAFNIPQKRERIYIVGFLKSKNIHFTFPKPQPQDYNIKDFLIETDEQFIIKTDTAVYQTFLKYLNNKYNIGKYDLKTLLSQDYLVLDTRQSDLRLYRDAVPTIRTGRQGILYVRHGHLRRLSGREALLLQGFDDVYARLASEKFPQSKILSLAGNAMTVGVMQAIGERILDRLRDGNDKGIVIARNEMTKQSSQNGLEKSVMSSDSMKRICNWLELHIQKTINTVFNTAAHKCGSFPHKIYQTVFNSSNFTIEDIKNNENDIIQELQKRIPLYFDSLPIKNTLERAIKLHVDGHYLFVCRTIYPEIENIICTEILEKNPNWFDSLDKKYLKKFQRNKHFKVVLDGEKEKDGIEYPQPYDLDRPMSKIGFDKIHFISALQRTFYKFDFLNLPQDTLTAKRHLYCHGVSDKADFMDSLNSLLLLDMTLQSIKEYKENLKLVEFETFISE